jgi:molybdate transport system permease protein
VSRIAFAAMTAVAAGVAFAFLLLPIVAIFLRVPVSELFHQLGNQVFQDALVVSIKTSVIAHVAVLIFGTPTAYLLARKRFLGRGALITLIELPLVLPPAVAGIALLAALGPNGILGGALHDAGITLVLQTAGVVVALTFVSAPFYIRQAQAAFAAVDPSLLDASRTLGSAEAGSFLRVAIPVALPGLAAGLALAWGRALGEFGATLMFAGSFRAITQTVPLAIYDQFTSDFPAALALSAVLVIVSIVLLLAVKLVPGASALGRAAG